ncbi:MAG: hypothetical protein Kow0060_07230 [Methylohalobius crimeensis]
MTNFPKNEEAHPAPPLLGFAAFSGTGKTTLLCRLIPLLKQRHLKIGLIKHAHHKFDIDRPGKDSYQLRQAGASPVMVVSTKLRAIVYDLQNEAPENLETPRLAEQLHYLNTQDLDLILVEGFKREPFPKIELHRPSLNQPLLFPNDPDIIAVATDTPLACSCPLPVLNLNQPEQIADFIRHDFLSR